MKSSIAPSSRRWLKRSALFTALIMLHASVPAWAGVVCEMSDTYTGDDWTNYNESESNGSSACGYDNNRDLDESGGSIEAGDESSAFGNGNMSSGSLSSAFGRRNLASGLGSNAFGGSFGYERNTASGSYSNAFGVANTAQGSHSSTVGSQNVATGFGNSAVGYKNVADGTESSAFGLLNKTSESYANAIGYANTASGFTSSAVGFQNTASAIGSTAYGSLNTASGSYSNAFGANNTASGGSSNAFGLGNEASATGSSAIGVATVARGHGSSAFGYFSRANGSRSIALGGWYDRDGNGMIDPDSESVYAEGISAVAVGTGVVARGDYSAALGVNAMADAHYSVALGFGAIADREYTISVGAAGVERQIVNLAAATQDTDAVNLSQLYPLATTLGGGASYAGGIFTGPTYVIQSGNYTNIGSAFTAVDTALTDINQRIVNAGGVQGERGLSAYEVAVSNGFAGTESDWLQSLSGAQGPAGPTGPEGPAGGGPRSVTYDSDTRDVLTMAGADGTRIANVADAVETNDAVNLGQMEAGDADTLAAANDYTDNTATETLSAANTYTDQRLAEFTGLANGLETFRGEVNNRFQQQDRRIDKQGSMSSAMLNMAMNASGSQSPRGRIAAGVGFQGGERALSVGYAKRIGQRASFSLGGAFSGSEKSAGMGFGLDL